MTRISHSAKETFLQCQEKYRLHYIEKLRSPILSSPLFLGASFDEALNVLLLDKKPKEKMTKEEVALSKLCPYEVLDKELTTREHNKEKIHVPTYKYAKYFAKDFDISVIKEEDVVSINEEASSRDFIKFTLDNIEDFIKACRNDIRSKNVLDEDTQVLYNLINWHSCRRKLRFLLDAYKEEVLPMLHEVHSVQKKIELSDGDHSLIGYIDFKASFIDDPDTVYTIDNKLASKSYPKDAIDTAVQLATYCEHEGNNKAAFIVTEKVLRKREPRHRIQVLKGTISECLFDKTFSDFGEVVYNINQGVFEKTGMDGSKQECFGFGQKCQFYNTCRGKPELDFLIDMKDK